MSLKGTITGYEWDFGDGSQTQKGVSVSHSYSKIGTYTVTLTVTEDTGATETATETVEVKSVSTEPEAVIYTTAAPDEEGVINGEIPFKISFDASKSTDTDDDIVSYDWDIDGESMVGQRADYTFETAGTYTVTLTVTDSEGQTGTDTVTVKVTEPGVKASISPSDIVFTPLAQGLLTDRYLQGIPEDSRAAKPHGALRPGRVCHPRGRQGRRSTGAGPRPRLPSRGPSASPGVDTSSGIYPVP